MKYLLSILLLLISLGCAPDTPKKEKADSSTVASSEGLGEGGKPSPSSHKSMPIEPPPPNPHKIKWENFWTEFTTAIKENNIEKIADMTRFPFRGMESQFSGKSLTREKFIANFNKIYDEKTKETFLSANSNFSEFALKKEKTAKEYYLPVNQKIYGVKVDYKTDTNPTPKKKPIAFYFTQENGTYKVYAARIGDG